VLPTFIFPVDRFQQPRTDNTHRQHAIMRGTQNNKLAKKEKPVSTAVIILVFPVKPGLFDEINQQKS